MYVSFYGQIDRTKENLLLNIAAQLDLDALNNNSLSFDLNLQLQMSTKLTTKLNKKKYTKTELYGVCLKILLRYLHPQNFFGMVRPGD